MSGPELFVMTEFDCIQLDSVIKSIVAVSPFWPFIEEQQKQYFDVLVRRGQKSHGLSNKKSVTMGIRNIQFCLTSFMKDP